jgi:hypothetical protein
MPRERRTPRPVRSSLRDDPTFRQLYLRQAEAQLSGRTDARFDVPLPRLPAPLFSIAAFFERSAVTVVDGASKTFTRNSVTGKDVTFHFCAECGSTVFWEPERTPQLIGVAVGAFGDPSFPPPEQSVFTTDKHGWLTLPEDMPTFAVMRPRPDR